MVGGSIPSREIVSLLDRHQPSGQTPIVFPIYIYMKYPWIIKPIPF